MEFGEWVQQIRKEMKLDVRSFAEKTGVDPSTISRIENLHTQPTIYTAFRICDGVDFSLIQLLQTLTGRVPSSLEKGDGQQKAKDFVTIQDTHKLIQDFHANRQEVSQELADGLNVLLEQADSSKRREEVALSSYTISDIEKIAFRNPYSHFLELKYPIDIPSSTIQFTYKNNGALLLSDIEAYMKNSRFKSRLPILGSTRSAAGISLERIKLADILKFDFEKADDLEIIDMFWEVCRLSASFEEKSHSFARLEDDGPGYHEEWEIRLATAYIIIYRWHQYIEGPDAKWLISRV